MRRRPGSKPRSNEVDVRGVRAMPLEMMEAFGGKGFFVEDPKDLKGALDEAMNHRGPALVNVVLSQGSARKPPQFRWHS
jgi:thiamine pyrophosphate-dependent acetolactate synthase large subunit-like protein